MAVKILDEIIVVGGGTGVLGKAGVDGVLGGHDVCREDPQTMLRGVAEAAKRCTGRGTSTASSSVKAPSAWPASTWSG